MPAFPILQKPSRAVLATILLALCLAYHPPAAAKKSATPSNASPEIADKQADLGELRNRIETLRKDLSSNEENKADAADRLRESERQISRLQRELHELGNHRGQLQKRLQNLELQSKELGNTLGQQQSQLEKMLYRQYLRGSPDSLQLLLNGDDPNQMARDLHYLSAIALTRAEMMGEINATLDRKKTLAADTKAQADELRGIETKQQERHAELEKQREDRKVLFSQISSKVSAQRQEIGNLQKNEKRLSKLIDRLSQILAAQAAQAAKAARAAEIARAKEAARLAEQAKQKEAQRESARTNDRTVTKAAQNTATPSEPPRSKAVEAENRYEPVASDGSFGRQKGKLRLPVLGNVSGRFGRPRDGGGTWKGLFIKAGVGSDVKAVANGRVVFSEWMRGFGNLLIVDHGDAYLSIYGNNDSLLKQVGQAVKGGETVATVGNSGGNPDSGLYFELRHRGQPIDPMKWASLK
ncbi:MAG: peptidoglycan DD-metalloendopeptidase family protein [Rhodocyclaceae bacterium]|nr:peptidoglycan DD-metalloendopeptidase family protein [Rhodocyclaceae bacterium]